jgi:hypothetical protein
MGAIVIPPLDVVLKVGNTSEEHATIAGLESSARGHITNNATTADYTVASGDTLHHPHLVIGVGRTWVVSSGAYLVSITSLTVDGDLTVDGESRVV